MPIFDYLARNSQGEQVQGQLDAADSDLVASQLLERGITPVKIQAQKNNANGTITLSTFFMKWRISLEELIFLCRQLYALSKAGVPIINAVSRVAETTQSRVLKYALQGVIDGLRQGETLSTAFKRFPKTFPPLFINMIEVGESSGTLEENFRSLSDYFQLDMKTQSRVKQATRYPVMVLVTMLTAVGIINFFVVPTFAKLFKQFHLALPWPTRVLITCSDFMVNNWFWLLMGVVILVGGLMYYLRQPQGRYYWDGFKLKLPVVGAIFQRIVLARFSRTFALMSQAGVPVIQAIALVAGALDNAYVSRQIKAMQGDIASGDSLLAAATASGLFSPLVLQMLAIGEESGNIDEMLLQTAEFYEREVDYDIGRLSDLIQPVMVICLGVLVLILALGVLLPMWDLVRLARH